MLSLCILAINLPGAIPPEIFLIHVLKKRERCKYWENSQSKDFFTDAKRVLKIRGLTVGLTRAAQCRTGVCETRIDAGYCAGESHCLVGESGRVNPSPR